MLRTLSIALSSMTLMLACARADRPGTTAAPPATPPADPAPVAVPGNTELENRGVAMMQRLAGVFTASANDCEKLAFDLKAFIVVNRELLDQLAELERTQSDEYKAAFEARNQAVQDAVSRQVAPVLEACEGNPSVQAAMAQFPS